MSTPRPHLVERIFHEGYMLTLAAYPGEDGRFQARVVVTALGGIRTRSQRFLDLDWFDTAAIAVEHARVEGLAWIRSQA
ncbi:MAG: hypothetical protein ABW067_04765 [Rhizobacter sp.]|jgi:hypothetical protein